MGRLMVRPMGRLMVRSMGRLRGKPIASPFTLTGGAAVPIYHNMSFLSSVLRLLQDVGGVGEGCRGVVTEVYDSSRCYGQTAFAPGRVDDSCLCLHACLLVCSIC